MVPVPNRSQLSPMCSKKLPDTLMRRQRATQVENLKNTSLPLNQGVPFQGRSYSVYRKLYPKDGYNLNLYWVPWYPQIKNYSGDVCILKLPKHGLLQETLAGTAKPDTSGSSSG